jgi:hypothetical protein
MEISLRERLKFQVIARAMLPLAEERAALEGDLLSFVEGAWPSLDLSQFQPAMRSQKKTTRCARKVVGGLC